MRNLFVFLCLCACTDVLDAVASRDAMAASGPDMVEVDCYHDDGSWYVDMTEPGPLQVWSYNGTSWHLGLEEVYLQDGRARVVFDLDASDCRAWVSS